jgi:hypothetical protein
VLGGPAAACPGAGGLAVELHRVPSHEAAHLPVAAQHMSSARLVGSVCVQALRVQQAVCQAMLAWPRSQQLVRWVVVAAGVLGCGGGAGAEAWRVVDGARGRWCGG